MSEQPFKPKRRFFKFTLRTLFVLLTVACVLLGLLGREFYEANRQRKVVRWVEATGGMVTYPYMDDVYSETEPPGPAWLRTLISIDFFSDVTGVYFTGVQVDDVEPLAKLTNLRSLNLSDTHVRDVTPLIDVLPMSQESPLMARSTSQDAATS